jgi:Uncharacterized conserved protein (DUF2304)
MIAQLILSILLAGILIYAWSEYARSPAVAVLALFVATAGLYFVWVPEHSTALAELVGIGRGVDLILYLGVPELDRSAQSALEAAHPNGIDHCARAQNRARRRSGPDRGREYPESCSGMSGGSVCSTNPMAPCAHRSRRTSDRNA